MGITHPKIRSVSEFASVSFEQVESTFAGAGQHKKARQLNDLLGGARRSGIRLCQLNGPRRTSRRHEHLPVTNVLHQSVGTPVLKLFQEFLVFCQFIPLSAHDQP